MKRELFTVNLNHLLVTLCVLCSTNAFDSETIIFSNKWQSYILVVYSVLQNYSRMNEYPIVYKIRIVQYLINVICQKHLQITSLVLLLESYKSYPVHNNYLQKYRLFLRKFFKRNMIGNQYYYNDKYIDTIALLNLRVVLLCSKLDGIYFLWLYLMNHELR